MEHCIWCYNFLRRRLLGPLLPGFQTAGSPRQPAGYHYEAKLRTASAIIVARSLSVDFNPFYYQSAHGIVRENSPSFQRNNGRNNKGAP